MRWPWVKRTEPPAIPPYTPPFSVQPPEEPSIVVEEHDTSAMSQTGVFKAWRRLTGQGEK